MRPNYVHKIRGRVLRLRHGYGVSHSNWIATLVYFGLGSLAAIMLAIGLRKLAKRYN